MISLLSRAKRISSTIIQLLLYIPLLAFLTNMLTVAILGKELATKINGGTIALPTFYYNIAALTLLYIFYKLWQKYSNTSSSS